MQNMSGGKTTVLGLDGNLGALLCYILTPCCGIGIILSLIFFFTEKQNKFVKFHALQSLLILAANVAVAIVVGILASILLMANMGGLATLLGFANWAVGIAFTILFIFVGVKAYQGDMFKVPTIGDLADKWSN